LVRLINPSIVGCGDHCRSVGSLWGTGPLAQCQGATP